MFFVWSGLSGFGGSGTEDFEGLGQGILRVWEMLDTG